MSKYARSAKKYKHEMEKETSNLIIQITKDDLGVHPNDVQDRLHAYMFDNDWITDVRYAYDTGYIAIDPAFAERTNDNHITELMRPLYEAEVLYQAVPFTDDMFPFTGILTPTFRSFNENGLRDYVLTFISGTKGRAIFKANSHIMYYFTNLENGNDVIDEYKLRNRQKEYVATWKLEGSTWTRYQNSAGTSGS